MSGRILARKPVRTHRLSFVTSPVDNSAWVQVSAATDQPCSAIEVFNPSGATLRIATGSSGNEVDIPYTILPGGSSIMIPWEISKGKRIAIKGVDTTQAASGIFVLNLFG